MAQTISHNEHVAEEAVESGTLTEALAGAGAVVLTILGLIGIAPRALVSISIIAVGGGLFFQGSMISAEYKNLLRGAETGKLHNMNISGGMSAEILTGTAGIALGILSLIGIVPSVLMPIAAIALGCGVAFSSGSISNLNSLKVKASGAEPHVQQIARSSVKGSSGAQVIVGLGAITLGIIGLAGTAPHFTLTVIAMLALGASILLTGLSLSGRMLTPF